MSCIYLCSVLFEDSKFRRLTLGKDGDGVVLKSEDNDPSRFPIINSFYRMNKKCLCQETWKLSLDTAQNRRFDAQRCNSDISLRCPTRLKIFRSRVVVMVDGQKDSLDGWMIKRRVSSFIERSFGIQRVVEHAIHPIHHQNRLRDAKL
ncbi:hypothetical protein ABKN59_007426 [Abortiporus biennis]